MRSAGSCFTGRASPPRARTAPPECDTAGKLPRETGWFCSRGETMRIGPFGVWARPPTWGTRARGRCRSPGGFIPLFRWIYSTSLQQRLREILILSVQMWEKLRAVVLKKGGRLPVLCRFNQAALPECREPSTMEDRISVRVFWACAAPKRFRVKCLFKRFLKRCAVSVRACGFLFAFKPHQRWPTHSPKPCFGSSFVTSIRGNQLTETFLYQPLNGKHLVMMSERY
jgi:hypothetical protein